VGPLANNLAAYAIYSTAQTEMRHASKLIEAGTTSASPRGSDTARPLPLNGKRVGR